MPTESTNIQAVDEKPLELDAGELTRLAKCEKTIAAGFGHFVAVGIALAEIRDTRLYRATHTSFEAYCIARLDIKKSQAYRLISGAAAVSALSPFGDVPKPKNEVQARELVKAPPDKHAVIMTMAKVKAGNREITTRVIRQAISELCPVLQSTPAETVIDESNVIPQIQEIPEDWTAYFAGVQTDVMRLLEGCPGCAVNVQATFEKIVQDIRTVRHQAKHRDDQ